MKKRNDKYIGKMLDGRYEILELIGSGGMANVYKALCHRLNRYDAVKIMHDETAANAELRKRFHAESHAVAMLSHPNIVSVYDVSHNENIEYIVMELIDGITLKQYLKEKGALSPEQVESFSTQIAKALSHAHEKGIIHRDIKPHNIMLLDDGMIKVADFGIAALQNDLEMPTEEAVGSVHYIAPEQARGQAADTRSDIYSLGIVMYEMLTGQLPYTGDSTVEIAVKHMNAEPKLPREIDATIPQELERITMKAMEADLNKRYQTAQELLNDLEAYHKSVIAAQVQVDSPEAEADIKEQEITIEESADIDEIDERKEKRKRKRARKVAFNSGLLGILAFIILLLVFLNAYLFKWLFSESERTEVANFIGGQVEVVTNDAEYKKIYQFTIREVSDVDGEYEEGEIIDQTPSPGQTIAAQGELIKVELTVATKKDIQAPMKEVPNVVNFVQDEAVKAIQDAGFETKVIEAKSTTVTKGYVISTDPIGGESLPGVTVITIVISSGPEIEQVAVPKLTELTKDEAIAKLESSKLCIGTIKWEESDYGYGKVVSQNIDEGTQVDAYTKIDITVSDGPHNY